MGFLKSVVKNKAVPTTPAAPTQPANTPKPAVPPASTQAAQPPQAQPDAAPKNGGGKSFLKRGAEARAIFAEEEQKADLATKNSAFRFFMENGSEAKITFLDGDFTAKGLEAPFAHEHFMKVMGKPMNFTCIHEENQSCPLCESEDRPSYVAYFTIIDHRSYTSKKDSTVRSNQRRLFAAKRTTFKQLQKLAAKRGGLRGWQVDVSRTGPKEPAVGNLFDFQDHYTDEQIIQMYGKDAVPFDYEAIIGAQTLTLEELRKLGFGVKGVGHETPAADPAEGYGM